MEEFHIFTISLTTVDGEDRSSSKYWGTAEAPDFNEACKIIASHVAANGTVVFDDKFLMLNGEIMYRGCARPEDSVRDYIITYRKVKRNV